MDEIDGNFVIRLGPFARLILPSSAFPDAESLRRFSDAFYAQLAQAGRGAVLGESPAEDARP